MTGYPRHWFNSSRQPLHPRVPTRAHQWLWFLLALLFLVGGPLYAFIAHLRGLITLSEVMAASEPMWIAGTIALTFGLILRWRRSKKLEAAKASRARIDKLLSRKA